VPGQDDVRGSEAIQISVCETRIAAGFSHETRENGSKYMKLKRYRIDSSILMMSEK